VTAPPGVADAEVAKLRTRYGALTPRERETLPLIVSGLRNKQAAAVLGISLVTIQIHRGNVMRKMKASSLSDLVRMSQTLQIPRYTMVVPGVPEEPTMGSLWSLPSCKLLSEMSVEQLQ
jgi:DNA-binding CsgD family transcriptional regulator